MFKRLFGAVAMSAVGITLLVGGVQAQTVQDKLLGQVDQTGAEVFGADAANQGDLVLLIGRFIRVGLSFVGLVLLVLFIYAGFLWMTAGGNEEKVAEARQLMQNGIIGLIIVVSSYAITEFVIQAIDAAT